MERIIDSPSGALDPEHSAPSTAIPARLEVAAPARAALAASGSSSPCRLCPADPAIRPRAYFHDGCGYPECRRGDSCASV